MKHLFILSEVAGFFSSTPALAVDAGLECSNADWVRISNGLMSPVTYGDQLRLALKSMMAEEMAPTCTDVHRRNESETRNFR